MARFRFRLEPLLKARLHAERTRQRAVAELERRRRELEDALRRKQHDIEHGKASTTGQLQGQLDMSSLRDHAHSTMRLMREAHRVLLELAGVHKQLDGARGQLAEAARDRRAIELLRDRRFQAWQDEQTRAETRSLDELAVTSASRKDGLL